MGRGPDPLFGPLCKAIGFLSSGPKLDPLLDPPVFACRPKMDPPPLINPGSAPIVEGQCLSVTNNCRLKHKYSLWVDCGVKESRSVK